MGRAKIGKVRLSLTNSTVRTTITVSAVLVGAFVATGFVNSAYERERSKLGDRHYLAGERLTGVHDLSGASEEFRKALLFAPDNQEYRLSLATALVNEGKLEEAQSHLEQLSQEDPTNGRINLLLAKVALQGHHLNEAMESYQRAVYEYWPPSELNERREARWELINLLEETGRNRNLLVGELLQLYGNLPPGSDQRMRVALLLLRNGADAEAGHVFRDILKNAGGTTAPPAREELLGAHLGLAQIAFRTGDFVEARHEYQRALRENPNDGEASAGLQLTNEVIDDSPQLPNISAAERLRRSQDLLSRVERDLEQCAGTVPPDRAAEQQADEKPGDAESCQSAPNPGLCALDQRLQGIRSSFDQPVVDKDDESARLQQAAQELWKQRAKFCPQAHGKDAVLEAVLPRLGHE